jgi:hypothetical protein
VHDLGIACHTGGSHASHGEVSFVNLQSQIQQVFEIIEALPGISVFQGVEEFDRYLARQQKAINPNP